MTDGGAFMYVNLLGIHYYSFVAFNKIDSFSPNE